MPKKQSSRIIALDLMRGYFLVSIILDHLNYWPSGFDWVTARGSLFVSAAEGFFLISGIVLGIVRGRKLLDKPFALGAKLLLKRGVQLYITYTLLAILFTLLGWWFFIDNPGLKPGIVPTDTPLIEMIWQVISFQYLYGWADYLRLYCLFLFVSPLVLLLLRRGWWWLVLGLSSLVFFIAPDPSWPASVYTQPYHWQLLFFAGMTIGFHWPDITGAWQRLSQPTRLWTTRIIVSAAVITIAANIVLSFGGEVSPFLDGIQDTLKPYFDKENLPVWRLALFAVWFSASFWFFLRFEKVIIRYLGWLLLPFGTNSLYVYTVHAFLLFFVQLFVPSGGSFFILNFVLSVTVIAIIRLMIQYKILFKIIPR